MSNIYMQSNYLLILIENNVNYKAKLEAQPTEPVSLT
jgi:hypothetical protein